MRNSVVQLGLIWILHRLGGDALDKHLVSTFLVASELAVLALRGFSSKELCTQRTTHDLKELLRHKLVALDLADLVFALAHGTLAS